MPIAMTEFGSRLRGRGPVSSQGLDIQERGPPYYKCLHCILCDLLLHQIQISTGRSEVQKHSLKVPWMPKEVQAKLETY